ncbi:MAG: hypothetical protein JXR53_10030 [Bacteroidales bacterium]|nr:hypothetical protein [Bacteroidales bacterium]
MEILEQQKLVLNQLMWIRKKVTQLEFAKEIQKIKKSMDIKGVCAPTWITAIHGHNIVPGSLPLIDIELFVQADDIDLNNMGYDVKDELLIENALCVHYEGAPQGLQLVHKNIAAYISKKKLKPSTPIYTVSDADPLISLPTMKASVYVGVSQS